MLLCQTIITLHLSHYYTEYLHTEEFILPKYFSTVGSVIHYLLEYIFLQLVCIFVIDKYTLFHLNLHYFKTKFILSSSMYFLKTIK